MRSPETFSREVGATVFLQLALLHAVNIKWNSLLIRATSQTSFPSPSQFCARAGRLPSSFLSIAQNHLTPYLLCLTISQIYKPLFLSGFPAHTGPTVSFRTMASNNQKSALNIVMVLQLFSNSVQLSSICIGSHDFRRTWKGGRQSS